MKIYKCDRCFEDISSSPNQIQIKIGVGESDRRTNIVVSYDLCEKCTKKIEELIKKEFNNAW